VSKQRVICYIDGFNLYHSIDSLYPVYHPQRGVADSFKWLNLWGLASAFIQSSAENLVDVFYFTALARWLHKPRRRHEEFIRANEHFGVTTILGHFKNKPGCCKRCGAKWTAHEEKQSDVNIAAYLLHHAHLDRYDKALVISADSDLCPAIQLILDDLPQKEIAVLVPPNRYQITRELRGIVTGHKIKQKHLKNNLLPATITSASGDILATRPAKYSPPV
jgi:uncharacterized LabA/DUF88 family protein